MYDVAVERGKILVADLGIEQVGPHCHQFAGSTRRPIQSPKQFLPSRLGSEVNIAGAIFGWTRAPALDGLLEPGLIRAVALRQGLEERDASGPIEIMVAIQHFARDRRTRRLATTGQQRLA